jgi:MscS family membrane protein
MRLMVQDGVAAQASEFWALTVSVWQTSFLGVGVGQGLSAIIILLLGFTLRSAVARLMVSTLKRMAARTKNKLDDAIIEALAGPLKLVPVTIAFFIAMNILETPDRPSAFADMERVIPSLVAIAIFWALHNAVDPFIHLMRALENALTPVMLDWLTKALRILFIVVGFAAVLQIWEIPVGGIIAGLGLFGVAVGLGAQDLFKNLIAGLLVLAEKRFLPGEWIKVDGVVEGTVEEINFRSTLVRRFDRSPVYVPNSALSDNAVTNFSRMTHRRIYWVIGVRYDTSVDQLKTIRDRVLDYVGGHDDFAQPPEVSTFMRVDSFGPSSIDFMLYCFTRTTNWGEWLAIKEELAFSLKAIVEEAGTGFAFPSSSIYIEQGAEVFTPPAEKAS